MSRNIGNNVVVVVAAAAAVAVVIVAAVIVLIRNIILLWNKTKRMSFAFFSIVTVERCLKYKYKKVTEIEYGVY